MGGFFGTIKKTSCVTDLFYGIDYNSHMGTKRAGMATLNDGVYTLSLIHISFTCRAGTRPAKAASAADCLVVA